MRYLGFPISNKKLKMGVFKGMVEKMRKNYSLGRERTYLRGALNSDKFDSEQHAHLPNGDVHVA
jgi:hypothetical protein